MWNQKAGNFGNVGQRGSGLVFPIRQKVSDGRRVLDTAPKYLTETVGWRLGANCDRCCSMRILALRAVRGNDEIGKRSDCCAMHISTRRAGSVHSLYLQEHLVKDTKSAIHGSGSTLPMLHQPPRSTMRRNLRLPISNLRFLDHKLIFMSTPQQASLL